MSASGVSALHAFEQAHPEVDGRAWWIASLADSRVFAHLIAVGMKIVFVGALLAVCACGTGEPPFRMVQLCLANPAEIDALKAVFRSVAETYRLPYYDNSQQTEAALTSIAEGQKAIPVAHPTVNLGTVGPTAMGFSASNFPDAPLQIVVGFSEANDLSTARRLSEALVEALSKRWRVYEVPHLATSGASPLKDCSR